MASMRLAAVFATLIGFIITNPTFLFSPVMFLPDEWKMVVALGVTVLVFGLVAITRLVKKVPRDGTTTDPSPDADREQGGDPSGA